MNLLGRVKMWHPPKIETKRLELREIRLSDQDAIFEYGKKPHISKYTLWEPHESVQDSIDFIEKYAFSNYEQGVPEPFAITLKGEGKLIGCVGCFWVSTKNKSMELAYVLNDEYWGQGIILEAADAVIEYCFEHFDIERIQCRCKSENLASERVMQKLGMTYEGTLRREIYHRNKFWDMKYYSILRD